MPVLSKFVAGTLGHPILNTKCHETIHTWHRDCTGACVDALPDALRFSLRTYATFYILTELLTKKDPKKLVKNWKELGKAIIQSSIFLTMNLIFYEWYLCRIRAMLGFFTLPTLGYTNGVLSSFSAILLEAKRRRPALALYLTNLASETLFNQLVNHGYLRPIPYGTFIPFAIGLALFKFLSCRNRLHRSLTGYLGTALRETAHDREKGKKKGELPNPADYIHKRLPPSFKEVLDRLKTECSRTDHCDHEDSCAYNALKGSAQNFSMGFCLSSVLTILRNMRKIIRSPTQLPKLLLGKNNFSIPIFFGLMPFIYHSMRCAVNRLPVRISPVTRDVASSAAAGAAMLAFPNIGISMFTMWKGIEALYPYLVEQGYAVWVPHGDIILYSLSTGYVLGCAALEPHSIRKGYIHFLEGLTGDRIKLFNRAHFDFYGMESSKLYGKQWQKIDLKDATMNPFLSHQDMYKLD